ncbi:MAG: hypothetical protein CL581_03550 [Alteromonadaceae bacterium]|nr:hypothetical protein [Alteromonadaceae bacterium]|tara:strand:- start:2813 stop:3022 length:210 start_codon:yes stop_codon:yes gene_type:complete
MTDTPSDVLLALGRLEGKVDALIAQEVRMQEDVDRIDQRLRVLEGSKAMVFGACAALGAIASYVVTLIA